MGSGAGVVPGWRFARSRRRRCGAESGARASEAGISIVETVLSVAIMGLAVMAIAAALGASVRHSNFTVARAEAEAEARRMGEWLRSNVTTDLAECDGATDPRDHYEDELRSGFEPGFTYDVTRVWVWAAGGVFNELPGACSGGSSYLVQRIELVVSAAGDAASATVVVVKRS